MCSVVKDQLESHPVAAAEHMGCCAEIGAAVAVAAAAIAVAAVSDVVAVAVVDAACSSSDRTTPSRDSVPLTLTSGAQKGPILIPSLSCCPCPPIAFCTLPFSISGRTVGIHSPGGMQSLVDTILGGLSNAIMNHSELGLDMQRIMSDWMRLAGENGSTNTRRDILLRLERVFRPGARRGDRPLNPAIPVSGVSA